MLSIGLIFVILNRAKVNSEFQFKNATEEELSSYITKLNKVIIETENKSDIGLESVHAHLNFLKNQRRIAIEYYNESFNKQ